MKPKTDDYWDEEEFEETVSAGIIACYETKVKRNKGAAPGDRLNEERVAVLRAEGPYFPGKSRLILGDCVFDIDNDRLPTKGAFAFLAKDCPKMIANFPDAYLYVVHVKQAAALGKYWHRRSAGALYEMLQIVAGTNGLSGERRFFTVAKDGVVTGCEQRFPTIMRNVAGFYERIGEIGPDENIVNETSFDGSAALQFLADRRHCWVITAQEKVARAHLGCMTEEIKSLLYARSLPLTSTGRKRPILHLVAAHHRRMAAGIDVDITAFLRGVQTVEISGTVFKVQPPAALKPELTPRSQRVYYQTEAQQVV